MVTFNLSSSGYFVNSHLKSSSSLLINWTASSDSWIRFCSCLTSVTYWKQIISYLKKYPSNVIKIRLHDTALAMSLHLYNNFKYQLHNVTMIESKKVWLYLRKLSHTKNHINSTSSSQRVRPLFAIVSTCFSIFLNVCKHALFYSVSQP